MNTGIEDRKNKIARFWRDENSTNGSRVRRKSFRRSVVYRENFPEINRRGGEKRSIVKDRSQETKRRRNFFSQSFIPLLSSRQSFLHSYIVSRSSLPLPFFSLPTFTLRERLTDERTPPSNYYYIKRFPWLFAPLTNDGGARSSSPCTEPLANSKVITSHGGRALCSRLSRNNSLSLAVLRALPFSSTSPFFIHPLSPSKTSTSRSVRSEHTES